MNLLLLSNLKTGFVHFQILHSRSFKDLRIALEIFLHTFGIKQLKKFCDSEGAFLKSETLSGGSREKHAHNLLESREGKEMIETNDIRFICHSGFHSYLSGFIESKVKVIKKSLSTFSTTLTFNQLNCVLACIAKVINCRPVGLYRQQVHNDSKLSYVTSFSLMYATFQQNDFVSLNVLSRKEKEDNIGMLMLKIKTQISRILNRYFDIVLYRFRPVYNKQIGFEATSLSYITPVLFRYRTTNVHYDFDLFYFGLIDKPHRGSLRKSRNVLIRTVKITRFKL